jgi:RNA polymerase sigma-70 factor (ECF subfamily)
MIQLMKGLGRLEHLDSSERDSIPVEVLPPENSHIECVAAAWSHNDEERLRELVARHLDFVWRYLRRIGQCPADCDEIIQEAFLVVARRLSGIREGCERSYLLQVAVNIASTRRRSFSRELVRIDQSAMTYSQEPLPDPEQAIEVRQARQELDSILLAMPLELRQVFVLYEIEEQNTREIAELLCLKEGTVASRLRRARCEFRRLIEQRSKPPIPIRAAPNSVQYARNDQGGSR